MELSLATIVASTVLSLVPLTALLVTVLNYLRKHGVKVRGTFATRSSNESEIKYISNITLENLKDRAVVIFGIYIKLGTNHYLTIEEFESGPIIIKPYESWSKEYPVPVFHAMNSRRYDIDPLLDHNIRKDIVLSTTEGKVTATKFKNYWTPVNDLLGMKPYTGIITPYTLNYKNTAYGSGVRYIIVLDENLDSSVTIPIVSIFWDRNRFRRFQLTEESLFSKDSLESLLKSQMENGHLTCKTVKVIDWTASYTNTYDWAFKGPARSAKDLKWWQYHLLGPIAHYLSGRRLRSQNRKTKQEYIRKLKDARTKRQADQPQ